MKCAFPLFGLREGNDDVALVAAVEIIRLGRQVYPFHRPDHALGTASALVTRHMEEERVVVLSKDATWSPSLSSELRACLWQSIYSWWEPPRARDAASLWPAREAGAAEREAGEQHRPLCPSISVHRIPW